MNDDMGEHFDDRDESLDRVLSQARWPEPSAQSEIRLRESWREIRASQTRRLIIGWAALAASVAVAIGVAALLARPKAQQPQVVVNVAPAAPVKVTPRIIARAPTFRERLALIQASPAPVVVVRAEPQAPRESLVADAIQKVVDDPSADNVLAMAKELRSTKQAAEVERQLIARATSGDAKDRFAAMQLLSELGGPASLPAMLQQLDTKLAVAAMPGVCRLAPSATLSELARKQGDAALRREMLTALVSRRDRDSLAEYLSFVLDSTHREEALAALRAMPDPPIDALLAEFDHSRTSYRLAAARAIGRICNGQVAPALIQMIDRDDHRREALAALTFCHDPAAQDFLAAATRSMRSEIQAVKTELANQL